VSTLAGQFPVPPSEFVDKPGRCSTIIETLPLLDTRYAKNPDFVSRRIVDEVVLVPIRRSVGDVDALYALNEVAAHVWQLLDGVTSLEAVRDALLAQFEVGESQAQEDLVVLIEQLSEIGAIREARDG